MCGWRIATEVLLFYKRRRRLFCTTPRRVDDLRVVDEPGGEMT
jgi:hypothetical protein